MSEVTTTPSGVGRPPGYEGSVTRSQLGMYVFLASDLMLFAAFFAAFYLLRSTAETWPPEGVHLDTLRAAVATAVLVASSGTMIVADRAFERGDVRGLRRWLIVTVVLGAAFLANQIAEYVTLDFRADDHTYGSIYWLLTGLHTAHVTVGVLAMLALVARTTRARSAEALGTWTRGTSTFWHLVDVVWIAVFVTIWVIR